MNPERTRLTAPKRIYLGYTSFWYETNEEGLHDIGYIRDDVVYATLKRWCKCGPRISCSFCAIKRELEAAANENKGEANKWIT